MLEFGNGKVTLLCKGVWAKTEAEMRQNKKQGVKANALAKERLSLNG